MKRFLTGLIFSMGVFTAQGQTLETGISINFNHLCPSNDFHLQSRADGLGLSLMARFQKPKANNLFLKNNEFGIEFSHGNIQLGSMGPSGFLSYQTTINYSAGSVTWNNYFVNFNTLTKGFQVALGAHSNFKILTLSNGENLMLNGFYNTGSGIVVSYSEKSLDGKNNKFIHRFNMGPTLGIAGPPFNIGKFNIRCRYDINAALRSELKEGLDFNYLRQRLTLSVVWGDLKSNRNSEK
jgi:hypothetical protein